MNNSMQGGKSQQSALAWFDLSNVDPLLAEKTSMTTNHATETSCRVVLKCQDDLVLVSDLPIEVRLCFQPTVDNSTISISSIQLLLPDYSPSYRYFAESLLKKTSDGEVEIALPWLTISSAKTYSLSVWIFCVRELVKKPSLPSYHCSVLLPREFRSYSEIPFSSSSSSQSQAATTLAFGVGKSKGRRGYMEDIEFVYESVKIREKESISLFGVLDGHGGVDCAQYVSEDIPSTVTARLRQGKSVLDSLFQSFRDIDLNFLQTCRESNAGSTACVLLFHRERNTVFIANTGDTRAVLCSDQIAIDLTHDRKASDPEEVARVVMKGGFVSNGRVMGILAISRAFGDYRIKRVSPDSTTISTSVSTSNTSEFNEILTADPEISCFSPCHRDEFVIVATDGLWDVMTSQQAVDFVRTELQSDSSSLALDRIAAKLVTHAVDQLKSGDNVTVMIVSIASQVLGPPRATNSNGSNNSSMSSATTNSLHKEPSLLGSINTFSSHPPTSAMSSNSGNSGNHLPTKTATSIATSGFSVRDSSHKKKGPEKDNEEDAEEDDLMNFLTDDSNFR